MNNEQGILNDEVIRVFHFDIHHSLFDVRYL
jgi:hypothetical protein